MSKYSVVREEITRGIVTYSIMMTGRERPVFRENKCAGQRLSDFVSRSARELMLTHLLGRTTRDEMMSEASDLYAAVLELIDGVIESHCNTQVKSKLLAVGNQQLKALAGELKTLEGPYGLFSIAARYRYDRIVGFHVDDISTSITLRQDFTVRLESSINAYHDLTGRILDEKRSTEVTPIYLDGMKVCASIRGNFLDTALYPLLVARLALMKGEPLTSLSKKTLLIKPNTL